MGEQEIPDGAADQWRELQRLGLEFYVNEEESIEKLCRKMTRRVGAQRHQLLQAARDEAMRTIPMAMSTWDERKGASLRTHVLGSVRWYISKVLKRYAREAERQANFCEETRADEDIMRRRRERPTDTELAELFTRDEVEYVLEKLSDEQADVLTWRFLDDMSLDEIALELDCSKTSAYRYVENAIQEARRIVEERAGDGSV